MRLRPWSPKRVLNGFALVTVVGLRVGTLNFEFIVVLGVYCRGWATKIRLYKEDRG